jgi:hypothetical protein
VKFKRLFAEYSETYDPEDDLDSDELGALRLYVAHSRAFNDIKAFWAGLPFDHGKSESRRMWNWVNCNDVASQEMGQHWPWTGYSEVIRPKKDTVPTTFKKLGKDPTLKLVIEGYLKTREVLFWSLAYEGPGIPSKQWFSSLLER